MPLSTATLSPSPVAEQGVDSSAWWVSYSVRRRSTVWYYLPVLPVTSRGSSTCYYHGTASSYYQPVLPVTISVQF